MSNLFSLASPVNYRFRNVNGEQKRPIAILGNRPSADDYRNQFAFSGDEHNSLEFALKKHNLSLFYSMCGTFAMTMGGPTVFSSGIYIENIPYIQSCLSKAETNVVLLVGSDAASCAKGEAISAENWRGSIFWSNILNKKCLVTVDQTTVNIDYTFNWLRQKDIARLADEASSPLFHPTTRIINTKPSVEELLIYMDTWPSGLRCTLDIEGRLGSWSCVSLARSPSLCLVIFWEHFLPEEKRAVLLSFKRLMRRQDVPKVLQNSLYDNFVLSYGYDILISPVVEDTMLKIWEIYSELPKKLSVATSLFTKEPYYKDERGAENLDTFLAYCGKDSCVTIENCNAEDRLLNTESRAHYDFNVDCLKPLLYMQHRGILYDYEQAKTLEKENDAKLDELGETLCKTAGEELRGAKGSLSAKRLTTCLYEKLGYPTQYKIERGKKTNIVTADAEALLKLAETRKTDKFLFDLLKHRHLEGIRKTLAITVDPDNRMRCGYNIVGTETGRLSCYASPTGAGTNLQTITKKLRNLYRADEGYDFFQCDLAGADGWTVAAHCARLGDPNMLEDYYFGIKPAKVIALLYSLGQAVNSFTRKEIKVLSKCIEDDWLYAGSKATQHGSNYLMGTVTMRSNLLKQSFKHSGVPIYLDNPTVVKLQQLYFSRYAVKTWHGWAAQFLANHNQLTSASGHTRIFMGSTYGERLTKTLQEFLADEPQQNTTYATNCAMHKLWFDPANRIAKREGQTIWNCSGDTFYLGEEHTYTRLVPGTLLIEPLHSVHDALCGQWPKPIVTWARAKVKEYFNNTLNIAGHSIIIPFDGAYGPSWGEQPNKL